MRASPTMASDFVLLEQEFDALGEFAHHLVLLRHHGGQIEFDLGLDAELGEIGCASWKRSLACSSALEGMQPTFRQVPPKLPRLSMQAVVRPSWPSRMAAL